MNKKEQERWLTDTAHALQHHLKSVGCVRKADNVDPDTMTVLEICDKFELTSAMWSAVRVKAWELDIPLCYGYFDGYYIGKKGEQIRNVVSMGFIMDGMARSMQEQFMILGQNGTMDDAREYARVSLNVGLTKFINRLKALGLPLPREAVKALQSGE